MLEKRKEYIDQLLSDLKLLEERLLSVKESDTLPFSFFSASFDRIEKIARSLHELELMQIGEMKQQMERLVRFLSESDGKSSVIPEPEVQEEEKEVEPIVLHDQPKYSTPTEHLMPTEHLTPTQYSEQTDHLDQPEYSEKSESPVTDTAEVFIEQEKTSFVERIILPEYKNPRITETISSHSTVFIPNLPEKNGKERAVTPSLNDVIKVPPALLDLKRGISLNDRFLFQRELFNNNRFEMDSLMDKLNGFANFEEAKSFLKSERDWNFEDQTVKDFLQIIKKGFE